jgi:hypothetical protein
MAKPSSKTVICKIHFFDLELVSQEEQFLGLDSKTVSVQLEWFISFADLYLWTMPLWCAAYLMFQGKLSHANNLVHSEEQTELNVLVIAS